MNPRIRRKVLEEWRGLPDPKVRDRTTPLGNAIRKLMPSLGLGERLREEEIREAWTEIVGDFLASHSRPAAFQSGVLFVQVLQPSVHYELERNWKREILQKLKQRFGTRTIREIRFRL